MPQCPCSTYLLFSAIQRHSGQNVLEACLWVHLKPITQEINASGSRRGGGILMDDININKPLHYRILYQTCEGLTAGGLISIRFSFPPNLLIDISG